MIFFFKQKTAYEMRISDWSSDVCSSDLPPGHGLVKRSLAIHRAFYRMMGGMLDEIEREHGRFVLLDIHSYNYRRDGPDGDPAPQDEAPDKIGRASCRERVCQYV